MPSSGPTAPSRRTIGGRPSFKWMSEAPADTASARRASRFIPPLLSAVPFQRFSRQRVLAAQKSQCPQRHAGEPVLLARAREVTLEQPFHRPPDERGAGE